MYFPVEIIPFSGDMLIFGGVYFLFEAQHTMGFLGSPMVYPGRGLACLRGQVKPAGCRRDDFLTTNY